MMAMIRYHIIWQFFASAFSFHTAGFFSHSDLFMGHDKEHVESVRK